MPRGEPLVELKGVTKDYRALRPLRIRALALHEAQSVALLGFDLAMAEVLVNLITGAHLPDTGEVIVFGQPTAAIASADEWVRALDQFGLVSDRAVLVDQFTAEQNLALPLTLDITQLSPELHAAVRALADEVSLPPEHLTLPTGDLPPASRMRLRLGRALALGPRVLLAEHPNASLSADEAAAFAADLARVVERRRLGSLVLTADRAFARAVAGDVLTLEPATGVLEAKRGWWQWRRS
jgi:ABC-type transporter Mla maintaining outer membrane lipid asymmetry ATPase subunit MlaF